MLALEAGDKPDVQRLKNDLELEERYVSVSWRFVLKVPGCHQCVATWQARKAGEAWTVLREPSGRAAVGQARWSSCH